MVGRRERRRLSWDNGYCFYLYCRDRHLDCHFVVHEHYIEAISPDTGLVRHGSLRHAYLLATSGVLIYSHTLRDLMYTSLHGILRSGRKVVFLQHGVTALKKFNEDYLKRRNDMDLFAVVSERERKLVLENVRPDAHRLAVTGFPRFDRYRPCKDNGRELSRKILYMPTWRDWIEPDGFLSSVLYSETVALLDSPELSQLLGDHGYTLEFILHINMRQHMDYFRGLGDERIRPVFTERIRLQDLIQECDLLVSDYSSISWDFLYLRKPVIFFRFDQEEYLARRGSYLDISREENLFGYLARNTGQVLEALRQVLGSGCRPPDRDEIFRQDWFAYFDERNCERMYQRIRALD